MTVKIIPITPEYREGWDCIDWKHKDTPCASPVLVSDQPHCASEIQGVIPMITLWDKNG